MPEHREVRVLPYTPEQLFDLVADVGSYGEFLPWVIATRVKSRSDAEMVADMVVGFKVFRETFTSRVVLDRPHHIHIDYVSGPLKFLYNDWRFKAVGGGTEVDFHVDFAFRQSILNGLAGAYFHEAFRKMVTAFETRAAKVYAAEAPSGSSSSSAQRTA
ncbi:type II toxin-antitoxin system RatA family toxin [Sphingosinicella microcystinivorans]|uniref:Coenzyme Q-binding protein COQ10 n=1 Tax=Sphingosinicella microcystinivorans TaxID=335406 RepID=A0AAD1G1N5_SPHMI|nr:type II toxin-antitoxin system RatA family toxin [Sphingosinicella microcystinivorans]RKS91990.1 coenzyme Q-binding protein COQ10 [Sphingosinicella microcystinivorans]BBE34978.1 ubiquinone-binding protein [Sphingosinicella microcystinivorans]